MNTVYFLQRVLNHFDPCCWFSIYVVLYYYSSPFQLLSSLNNLLEGHLNAQSFPEEGRVDSFGDLSSLLFPSSSTSVTIPYDILLFKA